MTEFFNPASPSICFVDLATFSEVTGFLYGGPMASTWFVAGIIKANWFATVEVPLRSIGVAPIFGARRSPFGLTRQADYALNATARAKFPAIGFRAGIQGQPLLRWVNNVMHNLISHVQLEFNDLTVEEFDSWWLDVNYEFRIPGSKRQGYKNMIGMVPSFVNPVSVGQFLPGGTLFCPLPFFFGEDSGFALPVAALPFNEIKITYDFRDWKQLIMIDPAGQAVTVNDVVQYVNGAPDGTTAPALSNVETWVHYAVVHQDERSKMGEAPRDLAMHQVQTIQATPFKDISTRTSFDIRMSHPIIAFFFLAQNVSLQNTFSGTLGYEQSNYTTLSELLTAPQANAGRSDPLAYATLSYENQSRMSDNTGYYSYLVPWFWSTAIPEVTGYHAGSYALQMWSACHPSGSPDYSKLANVSIAYNGSPNAANASNGLYPDGSDIAFATQEQWHQSWNHIFMTSSWNIGRVSHGSFGFPAL